MKLFKVIDSHRQSKNGGTHYWEIPVFNNGKWEPTQKTPTTGVNPIVCYSGYHLTSRPRSWFASGNIAFLAEGFGKPSCETDKKAYSQVRLLRPMNPAEFNELIPPHRTPGPAMLNLWRKDPEMKKAWLKTKAKRAEHARLQKLAQEAKARISRASYARHEVRKAISRINHYGREFGIKYTKTEIKAILRKIK